MSIFKVWQDDAQDKAIRIEASGMNEALDRAASVFGYADYADMGQARQWAEDEGLNIEILSR